MSATSNVFQLRASGSALARQEPDDRRWASRRRVLKAGIVAFNDRYVTLPCMVRDISDTGARLRIDGSMNAPDTFELIIEIDGLEADCEVAWRNGRDFGVRFVSAPRKTTPKRSQTITPVAPTERPSLRRKPKPNDAN